MADENAMSEGCDALDLSALWPCVAQIGCIPISEMFSQQRSSNHKGEQDQGEG